MQRSAFGAKCGTRVRQRIRGIRLASAASKPSCPSSDASASVPRPQELVARKSRRVWVMSRSKGDMAHSRLMNSSRFMSTRATATRVAASTASAARRMLDDAEDLQRILAAAIDAGFLLGVESCADARNSSGSRFAVEAEVGRGAAAASAVSAGLSRMTRSASAWAASTKTGSFIIVSACSGVFERSRRTQASAGIRRVEGGEHRIEHAAQREDVEAAAVALAALAHLPLHRATDIEDIPGQRRADARAADAAWSAGRWL